MESLNSKSFKQRLFLMMVMLVVAACGLLIPIPWSGRVATATFDLMHCPLFFCIAFALMWLVPATSEKQHTLIRSVLAVGLFVFSAAAEYAQQFVGRNTSWGDLTANCMGVIAGWICFEWWIRRKQPAGRILALVAALILAVGIGPAIHQLIDCVRERMEFPLLDSFEHGRMRWRESECAIKVVRNTEVATDGQYVLQWTISPGEFPGCQMYEPYPSWENYEFFEFDVQLAESAPTDQLTVNLKIQDKPHVTTPADAKFEDRFQRKIGLQKGETQHIKISIDDVLNSPGTRKMDLSQMQLIELFVIEPTESMVVYLDNVRLTGSAE
ncbi:VanZ family protein [bacterium]|nr:VanZ family protein [bacterium]